MGVTLEPPLDIVNKVEWSRKGPEEFLEYQTDEKGTLKVLWKRFCLSTLNRRTEPVSRLDHVKRKKKSEAFCQKK